jgi:hypothetical protein
VNIRSDTVTDKSLDAHDASELPDSFTQDYSCERILNEALRLQDLDPTARAGELLKLAHVLEHRSDVFPLCRMLFEAKPGASFRPPGLGAPVYIWRDSRETWPLEPITIYNGLPILVVRGYNLSGAAEWPIDYLQYCLTDCRWRTERVKPLSAERIHELMEEFIKLYPTGLKDVAWLRGQAEDSTGTTQPAENPPERK